MMELITGLIQLKTLTLATYSNWLPIAFSTDIYLQ